MVNKEKVTERIFREKKWFKKRRKVVAKVTVHRYATKTTQNQMRKKS